MYPTHGPQTPDTHFSPEAQAFPQEPQLVTSVAVATHLPPQITWPNGHVHLPVLQVAVAGHLIAQPPQLFSSNEVPVQTPEQLVCPLAQAQLPDEQKPPVAHLLPHAPQLVVSVSG